MHKKSDKNLFRIIDVNINRAREGLRVCEDICRFFYNEKSVTQKYKNIRHILTEILFQLDINAFVKARDAVKDVGKISSKSEMQRKNVNDIFYANSQRVKESIRVLEECSKLLEIKASQRFKELRYDIYTLEKRIMKNL